MRFTATSTFDAIARGAGKYLQWKIYCKKTSSLSEALTAGTWIDVTSRLHAIPPISARVEYELGQFKSDSLQLSASDIDWWEANVLNLGAGENLELKIELQIGLSETDLATDVVYAFSGWVDMLGIVSNELDDTLTLTVFSADEIANRMTAEAIVTRYIKNNVDGAGTKGIEFNTFRGVWVTDANIASYVLKPGVHTIGYQYNAGTEQAKLDDGEWVDLPISDDFITIGNADDSERVKLYVDVSALSVNVEAEENIVVVTAGDTLPYNWFRTISAKSFLARCFTEFGIATQTFDTLSMATYDSARHLSFLDVAPGDVNETGQLRSLAAKTDNTLYVAIDTKIYTREYTTIAYTLLGTMASNVDRLFYDATNNWLWVVYGAGTKLKVYKFASAAWSTEHTFTATADTNAIDKFEPNDSIIFTTTAETIRHITYNGTTFTDAQIFTAGTLTPAYSSFEGWGRVDETNNRYYVNGISGVKTIHYISWTGAAWVDGADFHTYSDAFTIGAWDANRGELYYWDTANTRVRYVTVSAESTVITLAGNDVPDMYYDPGSTLTYFVTLSTSQLYSLVAGTATERADYVDTYVYQTLMTSNATLLFGAALGRRLWQHGTTMAMYLSEADCEGKTIKQAMTKVCQAFNLMFQISSIKAAYVYRRGDDTGAPQTSGSTLTLNTDLAENLSKENLYGKAFDLIEITNGVETHTYDGTTGPITFDKGIFGDKRILKINNDWIPTELIKHLLYWMWQFYKTDRSLYRIPTAVVTLAQYEVLDRLTASFGASKIAISGSGPILGQTLMQDGSIEIEALI